MNNVFRYVTEIVLPHWVLEPLNFSCKIDTKTVKALKLSELFQFFMPWIMPWT